MSEFGGGEMEVIKKIQKLSSFFTHPLQPLFWTNVSIIFTITS